MKKIWGRYLHLLDNNLNTLVFDNFKNLVLCALLFAAGTDAVLGNHHLFLSVFASDVVGYGLIALSAALMFLNICDGVRRLAKLRHHVVLQVVIVLLYLVVSERVVEMVWNFRS
ncbi:hypothetical protein ALQ28_03774 [Pseudomonas syringae pv. delphinii]|uniref:Uncharacterized protein n=1 Tax=Pseudomonas syringae pv. delphinii TaxID=192088 RepID=A0A0P9PM02_9PSED|nr:hypothetical protein [Pseudomonas syringae group genomosp. 3]KPX19029.1 Uncharacterized protein ALO72_01397 [Pseudomonas syringae pv. delphinii]RMP16251.1 hypothetical protein ALQ28_03774 [Pseudomonas syringae pv. delphinii]RMP26214.1 hypothetical protein ALQ27_00680 [Pseudomonas syringae pv. delphinii]